MEHALDPTAQAPQLPPAVIATATPAVPRAPLAPIFGRLFAPFTREGRAARAELDLRADLARDLLAGRAVLSKIRGEKAERYLQGLDVLECRGQRLLEIVAIRSKQNARSLWRLTPLERSRGTIPNTAVGKRQRAWLAKLEQAGLIARMRDRLEKPWAG